MAGACFVSDAPLACTGPTTLILPSSAAPPVSMQQPSLAPQPQAAAGSTAATGALALPSSVRSLPGSFRLEHCGTILSLQRAPAGHYLHMAAGYLSCPCCSAVNLSYAPCRAAGLLLPQQRAPAAQSQAGQPGQPQQMSVSQPGPRLPSFAQMVMGHMPGQLGSQPLPQTGQPQQQTGQLSAIKQEQALAQISGLPAPQHPQQQQSAADPQGAPAAAL